MQCVACEGREGPPGFHNTIKCIMSFIGLLCLPIASLHKIQELTLFACFYFIFIFISISPPGCTSLLLECKGNVCVCMGVCLYFFHCNIEGCTIA